MFSFKSTLACVLLLVAACVAYFNQPDATASSTVRAKESVRRSTSPTTEVFNIRESKPATRSAPEELDLSVTSDDPAQQAACAKVEWTARHRLGNLDENLNLTTIQRQRIFPILVRGSSGYSPAMKAGGQRLGSDGKSMEDAICSELDPARQTIYQEMLLDDADWWSAAATRLESVDDEPITQPVSDSSSVP